MYEEEIYFENKLSAIRELKLKLEKECAEINKQIEELMQQRKEIAAPIEEEIAAHESEIKERAIEYGQSFKGKNGQLKYRKGYIRKSWDTKGLEKYAEEKPEIMTFLKETEVTPNVTIKVD
jgi:hypothetical protein